SLELAITDRHPLPVPPRTWPGVGHHLRQAPDPDADVPLVVRVQPRQLRASAPRQPGAVRVRPGAGSGNRAAATAASAASVFPASAVSTGSRPHLKLAFVVQRYGADIAGGSEAHCRQLAHHLADHHDITVLTTCARDYVSWANVFPSGESLDGRIRVVRFPVA